MTGCSPGASSPIRHAGTAPGLVWTAPRYLRAWDEYTTELERQAAQPARRQEWTPEQINATRNRARLEAARAESDALRSHTARGRIQARTGREPPGGNASIGLLARKRGKTTFRGPAVSQRPRYAGIPLVNADGWLTAILDPDPRRIGREQYVLHAGTLLLFTSKDRQTRFARVMKDYDPKPLDGWKTDHCCSAKVPDQPLISPPIVP